MQIRSKAEKARNLAYRKPLVKELCFDYIRDRVDEILEKCQDVRYISDSDNELIALAFDDDDEEYQFKMMFSDLEGDAERLSETFYGYDSLVPEHFDDWFCSMHSGNQFGGYMGYDSYEEDFVSLEYDWLIEKDSEERISKLTKPKIIDCARQCFQIFISWQSIETRYNCLESAINVILDKSTTNLKNIKGILEKYERMMKDYSTENVRDFERAANSLPEEVWVQ